MRLLIATFIAASLAGPALAKPPAGFREEANGLLIHKASGTEFPRKLGGFTRTYAGLLDPGGKDIAVSYSADAGGAPVVARIALLHVAMMKPHDHFIAMKPLVGTYFRDMPLTGITPTGDGPLLVKDVQRGEGWRGQFSARLAGKPYELSLSTLKFGYWSARMTAAYPAAQSVRARARLADLAVALIQTVPVNKPKN